MANPASAPLEAGACSAAFDSTGRYRYLLRRRWRAAGKAGVAAFIMLNPSTADGQTDDPTIRACRRIAMNAGFDAMVVANLFAFRATEPSVLVRTPHPIGPRNNQAILAAAAEGAVVIAAWGVHGSCRGRDRAVRELLQARGVTLHCLGTTRDGHPKHPLYLPSMTPIIPFDPVTS